MAISNDIKLSQENWQSIEQFGYASYSEHLDKYEIKNSADIIWDFISSMDKKIQKEEPFKVIKVDVETGQKIIHDLLIELARVSKLLQPFMPETAEKILKVMKDPTLENIPRLFPRVE
jgi:methionyl-tRNA synthetase